MIRKILKWIGIVLGSLVGLLVLAFAVLYIIGSVKWSRLHGKYDVPVETIPIPTDQASIARGEHIATIRMCGDCHNEILSGGSETVPGLVTLTFPNLTAGGGGVGATNTDQDWVRAIRHWDDASVDHALGLLLAADASFKETRVSSEEQLLTSLLLAMASPKRAAA